MACERRARYAGRARRLVVKQHGDDVQKVRVLNIETYSLSPLEAEVLHGDRGDRLSGRAGLFRRSGWVRQPCGIRQS